jgi:hypothetical protein
MDKSNLEHDLLCPLHTGYACLGPAQVSKLPAFQHVMQVNNHAPCSTFIDNIRAQHGLRINPSCIIRARKVVRGITLKEANERLQGISSFLNAFGIKNPQCIVDIEVNEDNSLHLFYVDAGLDEAQVQAVYPISFLDGYHMKTPSWTHQVLGATFQDISGKLFIAALALVPIENTVYWTWFMERIRRNKAMRRLICNYPTKADSEKGEISAFNTVFPEGHLTKCCRHLTPNMKDAKIYQDNVIWKEVAAALTFETRDEKWKKLYKIAPLQAEWLGRLDRTQWQTSEMLALGFSTFGATTNNIAESTGFKLLARPNGK